ncbi:MAG: recombination mediator RecR [Lactobacillales bacterium]|jgi:recombination protein RecR|nr:recombination mediator RecR [Lactobacillales bacterium]
MGYPLPINKLIESYLKLPGIGMKTATRLAFYTLNMKDDVVNEFAKSLISVKRDLMTCEICGNISASERCDICANPNRDEDVLLVVEESKDISVFENMNRFTGRYHVLGGVLSPIAGTGPDDLNITGLLDRLMKNTEIKEIIIATNANTEGEATAMYLSRLIAPSGVKVSRLAHGLAVGSDIEYADEVTLFRALEGRREI